MCTDLKDGRGKLCAGQTRVVSLDCSLVIPFEFMSSENFGLALPIGSGNGKYGQPSETLFLCLYLNAGMRWTQVEIFERGKSSP